MKTQKIVPIGRIHVKWYSYYLVNPHPLEPEWEDAITYKFLVIPYQDFVSSVHKCPREIVVCGDFLIEYDTTIRPIECELPYDILDETFITTEIGQ
jgi:hypothetical protein